MSCWIFHELEINTSWWIVAQTLAELDSGATLQFGLDRSHRRASQRPIMSFGSFSQVNGIQKTRTVRFAYKALCNESGRKVLSAFAFLIIHIDLFSGGLNIMRQVLLHWHLDLKKKQLRNKETSDIFPKTKLYHNLFTGSSIKYNWFVFEIQTIFLASNTNFHILLIFWASVHFNSTEKDCLCST